MTIQLYLQFVILPLMAVTAILIFIRFLLGPSLSDRVVSLELLMTTAIGMICVFAVVFDEQNYMDVAVILALISFLTTVAFSYYIEKQKRQ
ncbi:cation:proton antiporter [Membranicola marinus]|uniref:Cation:proton antiporter n=1 Tax=Membranihabitans marinus TaxID=1227546 RepID=A0A953HM72_9BACT|nr:cation:proton antiporter [Membranihabitans marinus]MBY5958207.1 cation:proton antiporter [Membranihabitans marinus]